MIAIKVNQEDHHILEHVTLQEFVENLKIQTNGIAIAINNTVVKKIDWWTRYSPHRTVYLSAQFKNNC